ncbi:MAG: DUF1425 domain-containing protein [Planctomycetota bacterium]
MQGRWITLGLVAIALLAVSGCRSSQGTNRVVFEEGETDKVVVDKKLDKLVRVQELRVFNERGDTMQPQMRVENMTGRSQSVTYQWVWLEGQYELPESSNTARVLNLEPREQKTITATAPNPAVDGFVLRLNRAN